jgi:hypothetical protein
VSSTGVHIFPKCVISNFSYITDLDVPVLSSCSYYRYSSQCHKLFYCN